MSALRTAAYLPIAHEVRCARLDPDCGPCDCAAVSAPLVLRSDAERLLAECRDEIARLRGTTNEYNDWIRFHAGGGSFDAFIRDLVKAQGHG